MTPETPARPSPHHIATGPAMTLAGLSRRFTATETAAIPALWQQFGPWLGNIEAQTGEPYTAYGLCYNQSRGGLDYMCGVEVADGAPLPPDFATVRLSPQTYAVFPHTGHISSIRATWDHIWDPWLPESGLKVLPEPFFEKYGPSFNGMTGEGSLEIWIPVAAP